MGAGTFVRPHGIFIGRDDTVYCTDDFDHTVRAFSTTGKLRLTLGVRGRPSDTGATSVDYRTIRRAGPPFHYPTNLARGPAGDLYVADGYGNARVHHFSADGRLLHSWGEPGSGPGQFNVPHGIAVDQAGIIYVADRENSRIQLFSPDGAHLKNWTNVTRPCQVFIDRAGGYMSRSLGNARDAGPALARRNSALPAAASVSSTLPGSYTPVGAVATTRVRPATSSHPTTSASIRGATSTSRKLRCQPAHAPAWSRVRVIRFRNSSAQEMSDFDCLPPPGAYNSVRGIIDIPVAAKAICNSTQGRV